MVKFKFKWFRVGMVCTCACTCACEYVYICERRSMYKRCAIVAQHAIAPPHERGDWCSAPDQGCGGLIWNPTDDGGCDGSSFRRHLSHCKPVEGIVESAHEALFEGGCPEVGTPSTEEHHFAAMGCYAVTATACTTHRERRVAHIFVRRFRWRVLRTPTFGGTGLGVATHISANDPRLPACVSSCNARRC